MADNTNPATKAHERENYADDEIDLLALLGALLDRRWTIISITAVAAVLSIVYALIATPIYQAGSMLQVEEKSASLPGLAELSEAFMSESSTDAEIEIIKSRSVIGEAVDNLNLQILAEPRLAPLVGDFATRRFVLTNEQQFGTPWAGLSGYAWGGERILVDRFDLPDNLLGELFTLIANGNKAYTLEFEDASLSVQGKVGEVLKVGDIELFVSVLSARPGTHFDLQKLSRLKAIQNIQQELGVSEVGRQTGIVKINFTHPVPAKAEAIVDEITSVYVEQNVRRLSAEAENSLQFLKDQLPYVKQDLEAAETALNQYQAESQSIDITEENKAILEQLVDLETRIQELDLQRVELSRRFTANHPNIKALEQQYSQLKTERNKLNQRIQGLPSTQQKLFSLRRDVEVGNGVYELLLYKSQEMEVARASTVGNVRVVDTAIVDVSEPVKPKKALIVVVATLLGGFLSVVLVLIQRAMHSGIGSPDEIESLGTPVFATVPFSDEQERYDAALSSGRSKDRKGLMILAEQDPTDGAIEMMRNLRTSLYFNLTEARNKAVLITGPSPGVGKSFVSVNLATVSAQAGQKVLLIDADLRRGYLHRYFNDHRDEGLAGYLAGRVDYKDVIHQSTVENLHVITRGKTPPNPSELLMHERFDTLLNQHLSDYDLIIIDTPPVLAVTDASIVGRHTGNALMVTRFEVTGKRELQHSIDKLARDDIHVTGAILNGVKKRLSNYYGYGYYGYNYSYKYKSNDD